MLKLKELALRTVAMEPIPSEIYNIVLAVKEAKITPKTATMPVTYKSHNKLPSLRFAIQFARENGDVIFTRIRDEDNIEFSAIFWANTQTILLTKIQGERMYYRYNLTLLEDDTVQFDPSNFHRDEPVTHLRTITHLHNMFDAIGVDIKMCRGIINM